MTCCIWHRKQHLLKTVHYGPGSSRWVTDQCTAVTQIVSDLRMMYVSFTLNSFLFRKASNLAMYQDCMYEHQCQYSCFSDTESNFMLQCDYLSMHGDSLWRRANAQNVSFRISLRWPIYIINTVYKPNYLVILPPTQHHSFFRNLPPLCMVIFFIFLIIPVTCSNALSLVSTNIMQNPLQRVLNDFLIAKFQDDHYISSYEIFFP